MNVNGASGIFDISAITAGGETIGSLAGVTGSSVVLGGRALTAGGDGTSTIFAGVISGAGGSLTKAGAGSLTLTGLNTYAGVTTVNAGTLLVGTNAPSAAAGALGNASSAVLVGDTSGAADVALLTNGAFTVGRNLTIQSGNTGVITVGGNTAAASIFSGTVSLGTASGTAKGATLVALSGGSVDFQGIINENTSVPASNITIGSATHTGTVIMSNASNGYSGSTTITNGVTLNVAKLANGGSNSSIGNNGSSAAAGSAATGLVFSGGGTLKYAGTGDSTNRLFTFDASGATIDASAAANGVLSFTGTGALVASGSGDRTLTLAGTSTGANAMASVIADPGTGTTSLTKSGAGTWVLTGANTYTGATTISGGTLQIGNGGTAGSLSTSSAITNDATLVFNRSDTITQGTDFASAINGTGAVTQAGAGTLVLNGTNGYTGATTVSAGSLVVSGSIGSSSLTTINGGTLLGTGTVGAIQLNSGSVINAGAVAVAGTLSTGTITITDGQLVFDIGGTGGGAYDQLGVSGTINLTNGGAGAQMVLNAISSYAAVLGDSFTLVSNDLTDAISGAFAKGTFGGTKVVAVGGADYVEGLFGSAYYGRINYAGGTDNNDVVLTVATPLIAVYDGATVTDPQLTDGQAAVVGFGQTTQGGGAVRSFTIRNTGGGPLIISSITAPAGYSVASVPSSVAPGANATFTVTLTAASTGTFSGSVVVNSNDLGVAAFDFPVTGQVNPQVVVTDVSPNAVINVELGSLTGFTLTVSTPTSTTYTLTRPVAAGNWVGTDVPGVVTGFNTSRTLTVIKAAVSAVNITDSNGTNNVTFFGRGTSTDGTLNYDDNFTVTLDGPLAGGALFSGNNEFAGTASLTVAVRGVGVGNVINVQVNTTLQSANGNITLSGNYFLADAPSGGGTFYGITQQGTIKTTGSGNIALNGRGGSGSSAAHGINTSGATIASEGTGTVTLTGIGGKPVAQNAKGMTMTNTIVSSAGGTITLTGTSSATTGTGHSGILLQNSSIQGTNPLVPVVISLNGTGADALDLTGSARSLHGVELTGTSSISTAKGSISIVGVAGTLPAAATGNTNYGVQMSGTSQVFSTGDATISIDGTGGAGGSTAMTGVLLGGTGKVSVADGNLSITGTSGGSGGNSENGVQMGSTAVVVESTGSGNIVITGKRAVGAVSLGDEVGFQMQGAAGGTLRATGAGNITVNANSIKLLSTSGITTISGDVTLRPYTAGLAVNVGGVDSLTQLGLTDAELDFVSVGTGRLIIGGSNAGVITQSAALSRAALTNVTYWSGSLSIPAINVSTGALTSTGGDVTLIGDAITINTVSASIDAGAGTTTLRPQTAGALIGIGDADVAGTLGLTDTELDRITAGRLTLGSAGSGAISMSGGLSRTSATAINLVSGGAITVSQLIDSNGGNVTFTPGTSVNPTGTGTDVSMGLAGTLSFPGGGELAISIEGTTANDEGSGYRQLKVGGGVNLTGVDLVLSGAYVPQGSDTYMIVDNDGADAVVGTFNGLPQDGQRAFNGRTMIIDYAGGDGNDVVLRRKKLFVTESGSPVADGGTYNFGDWDKVAPPLVRTFTVLNDGLTPVSNILVHAPTGLNAGDYTLNTTGTASTLAPLETTTFTLAFDPSALGVRTATFFIEESVSSENLFESNLTGVGTIARDVSSGWNLAYGGPDAPGITRNGSANAVAVQKVADEAVAVFATGYTTNAAGNKDIYTVRRDPVTGVQNWAVTFGAAGADDEGSAIVVDGNGDVVITGYIGIGGINRDVYVAKYDGANGSLKWSKTYPGAGGSSDGGTSVAVDASGNVAVAGYAVNATGGMDMFAARYSADGTTVFFERLIDGGNNKTDVANSVAMDSAGNVMVAGYARNAANNQDFRVMKLDAVTGATAWQYNVNGSTNTDDLAYAVAVDASGNVVATGSVRGSTYDLYTVKLSNGGALDWQKQWNSTFDSSDAGYDLAVDASGNVIVAGTSYRSASVQDGYVVKYNGASGDLIWDRRFNGPAERQDLFYAVDLDADGNAVATGYSQNAAGNYDVLTAKMLASDGSLFWEQRFNGAADKNDSGAAVAVSPDGNVFVAGYTTTAANTTDFWIQSYMALTPAVQTAQTIAFANPGAQTAGTPLQLSATATSGLAVWFAVVSGPATIDEHDNTRLNFTGVGTVVVRASQRGNNVFAAAANVDQSVAVVKDNQSIDFGLPPTVTYAGNTVVLGAAASSGLPVTYGVVSGPGVINGNVLSFSGSGLVTVSADQAGDPRFNAAAQVQRSVNALNTAPVIIPAVPVEKGWQQTYAGSGAGEGRAVALEIAGNSAVAAFVTGSTTNGAGNKDIYLMKFNNAGGAAWTNPVVVNGSGNGDDEAVAVAVDATGDVYISGYVTVGAGNTDIYVAKFSGVNGTNLWNKTFAGNANGADAATGLVLEGSSRVVIGGYATNTGTGRDFFAARLQQSDGLEGLGGWIKSVNSSGAAADTANAIAVGSDGNVALAGSVGNDALTMQLAAGTGSLNWQRRYNAASRLDAARGVVIDANNDVIITAYAQAANYNIYTAKYSRLDGSIVWEKTYNGSYNSSDAPWALALDPNGDVIVAGTSYRAASVPDSMTLKYDGGAGTLIWEQRYNGPDGQADEHYAVSVDVNGNAVVSGYSLNSDGTSDIYTAKLDSATGVPLWQTRFNGAASKSDVGRAVAADPSGRAWVAGYETSVANVKELLLVKYQPVGFPPPPLPAPPPALSEGDASELFAPAPPPPVVLQMSMTVEHGDTARFAAGYYDAEGNDTVGFSAVIDGIPGGSLMSDATMGAFEWEYDTSTISPGLHDVVITATDTDGATSSVNLAVMVNASHPDRTWRWQNFGSTVASGDAADDADPDRDGLTNLAEFAFGLNPTRTGSDVGTRAEAAASEAGSGMRAVFRRRKDHLTAGIDYIVEFSSNLSEWTPSSEIPAFVADEGDVERVSLQFPIMPNGQPGRFFRVRVEQQNIGQ